MTVTEHKAIDLFIKEIKSRFRKLIISIDEDNESDLIMLWHNDNELDFAQDEFVGQAIDSCFYNQGIFNVAFGYNYSLYAKQIKSFWNQDDMPVLVENTYHLENKQDKLITGNSIIYPVNQSKFESQNSTIQSIPNLNVSKNNQGIIYQGAATDNKQTNNQIVNVNLKAA